MSGPNRLVKFSNCGPTLNDPVGDVAMYDHNDRHWNCPQPPVQITATLLVTMLKVGVVREASMRAV